MKANNIHTSPELLSTLQHQLGHFQNQIGSLHVLVGFDGFVDKVQKVVKRKESGKTDLYFQTISEWASHTAQLTGRSGQFELVTEKTKMGGNAPIMANALSALGIQNTCVGAVGYPEPLDVFRSLPKDCELIPVNNPGLSQAIEFTDGKVILSELTVFQDFDWPALANKVNLETLRSRADNSMCIALLDWANLPHATSLWAGFLEHVVKQLNKAERYFLFDFCDPSKKTAGQIREVLELVSSFSAYGKTVLGLNENESTKLWLALEGQALSASTAIPPLQEVGTFIFNAMNINTLLIHPTDRTIAIKKEGTYEMEGHVIKKPTLLTGAGDNLNAGFCAGLLLGLSTPLCMLLGMASSGAYVKNGYSASAENLIHYIEMWKQTLEQSDDASKVSMITRYT